MNMKNTLLISTLSGFIVGVLFIYVQPLFGMTPLTDRHAAAYTKLSNIGPSMALVIAWAAHLLVSVCYGIATGLALYISNKISNTTSKKLLTFGLQIFALGWFTTVIAGPANQLIVRLVTSNGFPSLDGLPPLNFNFDAKLVLHLIFFLVIGLFLLGYSRITNVKNISQAA